MNNHVTICLLVINYNGMHFLPRYLPAISEQCSQSGVTLIITDDASTDDSLEFLIKGLYNYTSNNGPNRGFAANVNAGIQYAKTQENFDYFIIANNDIIIPEGVLENINYLLPSLQQHDSKVGLIGFTEILANNTQNFAIWDYPKTPVSQCVRVKDIPGFFFIISKDLISAIGLLDESYYMYGEDNDYFARTVKAGYHIYQTGIPVLHFSEASSTDSKQTAWYVYRNAFLYAQRNLGFPGCMKMLLSFMNQVYNPFYRPRNAGNFRVTRNGFFYNNYLLGKSLLWNIRYFFTHRSK